jgi:prophage antirepressor-like protein
MEVDPIVGSTSNSQIQVTKLGETIEQLSCNDGKDVCEILGYSNSKQALFEHVKSKYKKSLKEVDTKLMPTSDSQTQVTKLGETIEQLSYNDGKDVCEILEYSDIKKALQVNIKSKHKKDLKTLVEGCGPSNSNSQNQVIKLGETFNTIGYHDGKAIYISEPGLYSIIMHSKTSFAEKF